jgi:peptidoglycan/LPS O-acetylase OafA/YrhL
MNSTSKSNYSRPDIQGLRGIAVISVLLFHYFPKLFSMGFLGVDLFFVISGYLITSIISRQLEENKFSFKLFFLKRFCRIIIPILFIFLFFCFISFFILLPKDLNNLWSSVLATLLFIPNFYFWLTGGYFGTVNEYKSFLHLWSIGLELQFYFFFPFILTFVLKNYYTKKLTLILIFSIILFIIYLLIYNTAFSFFILPGRLWEFCLGALVFFLPKRKRNLLLYYISLFLIFLFLFFSFKNYEFLNLFIIVIAAGYVIYYNSDNLFLNNKIFIFFGKISYSLYLLHWPTLVFIKYYLIRDLFIYETFFLIFFSVVASYYFWLFIEDYFRKKLPLKFSIKIIVILYVVLFIFFTVNFFNNSFVSRLAPNNLLIANSVDSNFRCKINNLSFDGSQRSCNFFDSNNKNEIVLLGNSHAQMYGYAFENIVQTLSVNGRILALDGCLPTTTYNISKECIDKAAINLSKIIEDKNITVVLIGMNWDHSFLFDKYNNKIVKNVDLILVQSLHQLSLELNKYNKKIFVIGPISIPEYNFAFYLSRKDYFKNNQILLPDYNDKNNFEKRYQDIFNYLNNLQFVTLVKPHEVQCTNSKCNFLINGKSIFSDNNHLSKDGSLLMQDLLLKSITEKKFKN